MIREFSEDWQTMADSWKYVVEEFEEGIEIKYMEKEDGIWKELDSINISGCCSALLFKTIADDFKNGVFGSINN